MVACTALECRPDIPGYKPLPGPEQRFAPEPEERRSEIDQTVQRIMDWLSRLLGRQPEVPPMPLPRPIPDPNCKVELAIKGNTADSGGGRPALPYREVTRPEGRAKISLD